MYVCMCVCVCVCVCMYVCMHGSVPGVYDLTLVLDSTCGGW